MSSSVSRAGAVSLILAVGVVQVAAGGFVSGGLDIAARAVDVVVLSVWLGTAGALAIAASSRTDKAAPPVWFGRLGMACAAVLAASCLFQAVRQVDVAPELFGTRYGLLVLAKLALLGLALVGLSKRPRFTKSWAVAGAALLVVSGALAATAPPVAPTTGSAAVGDLVVAVATAPEGFTVAVSSSRRPPPAPISAASASWDGRTVALRELEPGRFLGTGSLDRARSMTVVVWRGADRLAVRIELARSRSVR